MNKNCVFGFVVVVIIGTYAFMTYITETEDAPIPTPVSTLVPTPTPDLRIPTYQAVAKARKICLIFKQTNSEVEPDFTRYFKAYLGFVLKSLGISTVSIGSVCDAKMEINLEAIPLGADYSSAPAPLCYTGAGIQGLISVSADAGEPIVYEVNWATPVTEGVIVSCNKKFEAPFPFVIKQNMFRILHDLWGIDALVADFIDNLQKRIDREGEVILLRNCCGFTNDEFWRLIAKDGEDTIPIVAKYLKRSDPLARAAGVNFMGVLAIDHKQAAAYLVEMLDDPYQITANYKEWYPIQVLAHDRLVAIYGQDFAYDKEKWLEELKLSPPAP